MNLISCTWQDENMPNISKMAELWWSGFKMWSWQVKLVWHRNDGGTIMERKLAEPLVEKKKRAAEEKVAQMPGKLIRVAKPIPSIMEKLYRWLKGLSLIFEKLEKILMKV